MIVHNIYIYIYIVIIDRHSWMDMMTLLFSYSSWSDPLLPDLVKQDNHHFECHLVSRLPQVLLLHCVPLHPRWLHHCHPTCRQWHFPHSDLPPTWHHLQYWGGGCEEWRWSRRTEGKGYGELYYWTRWWVYIHIHSQFIHTYGEWSCQCVYNSLCHTILCTCAHI